MGVQTLALTGMFGMFAYFMRKSVSLGIGGTIITVIVIIFLGNHPEIVHGATNLFFRVMLGSVEFLQKHL